jgi:hypothetical protein
MSVNFWQRSLTRLIVLLALMPGRSPAFAATLDNSRRLAPEESVLRVSADFDGDSKTDTALAKFGGSNYGFELHLSTKRARIRLTAPVRNEVGFELIAFDVNQDKRTDLILTSRASIRPIAVWLNMGNGSFERRSGMFGPFFGNHRGPRFVRGAPGNDGQAVIPTDEQAGDFAGETLAFHLETSLIQTYSMQVPLTSSSAGSASPRGPPNIRQL